MCVVFLLCTSITVYRNGEMEVCVSLMMCTLQNTSWRLLKWALDDGNLEHLKLVLDSGVQVDVQDDVSAGFLMLLYFHEIQSQ